jgi:hypothetical protein
VKPGPTVRFRVEPIGADAAGRVGDGVVVVGGGLVVGGGVVVPPVPAWNAPAICPACGSQTNV